MPEPGVTQWPSIISPVSFIAKILFPGKATAGIPPPPTQEDVTPTFLRSLFFGPGATVTDASVAQAIAENEARIAQEEAAQLANVLALRPPAQLTREPVPIRVPVEGTIAPPSPTPPPPPETAPGPVQAPGPSQLDEFARLYAMAFGFSDITGALGELTSLVSGVQGLMGSTQTAPVAMTFAPAVAPAVRAIGGGVVGGALGGAVSSFFGGNGNGTALQRIKADAGRPISRRQVINMARVCGLEQTAATLNTSVSNVCEVVSKGMPRRSRGISSRDMARTRSTLGKLNTMQRSLSGICPTRRAPRRRVCK